MVPTYNGWEDTPEDEREVLDLWELAGQSRVESRESRVERRDSRSLSRVWA